LATWRLNDPMAGSDRKRKSEMAAYLDATAPAVILCQPQMGENIGTAARAMLNCGLSDMRLVKPRDGWPNPKALNASSGADEVISRTREFDSTREAVGELDLIFATTARNREQLQRIVTPRQAAAEMRAAVAAGRRVGMMFGPERTGLDNEDIGFADVLVMVPLNPAFSSLNLAQAVLLLSYEWFTAGDDTLPERLSIEDAPPADKNQLASFFEFLDNALNVRGFYPSPEMRPKMVQNMRAMFNRTGLTQQDVQTLYGMFKQLTRPVGSSRRRQARIEADAREKAAKAGDNPGADSV